MTECVIFLKEDLAIPLPDPKKVNITSMGNRYEISIKATHCDIKHH